MTNRTGGIGHVEYFSTETLLIAILDQLKSHAAYLEAINNKLARLENTLHENPRTEDIRHEQQG